MKINYYIFHNFIYRLIQFILKAYIYIYIYIKEGEVSPTQLLHQQFTWDTKVAGRNTFDETNTYFSMWNWSATSSACVPNISIMRAVGLGCFRAEMEDRGVGLTSCITRLSLVKIRASILLLVITDGNSMMSSFLHFRALADWKS